MGVTKTGNRTFRARYSINGVRYNVGTFKTAKEAHAALGKHYWDNPAMMKQYVDVPAGDTKYNPSKPRLTERVKTIWGHLRKSLENKGLL